MKNEFFPLGENDTKEFRKEIGLPILKPLRYMKKTENGTWKDFLVEEYRVVETLSPSGVYIFEISLNNGEVIRILQEYFVEMQKPSFVEDMEKQIEGNLD